MRVCFLLAATIFVTISAGIGIARLTYRDPFAPYLAIMPGQSIDALKNYPCRFIVGKPVNVQIGTCNFPSDLGPFGQITLTTYNHVIGSVYIQVQPDRLHFGDLTLCWGKPLIENFGSRGSNRVARWGAEVSTDITLENESVDVNNSTSIQYLIIEGGWRSCRSA